MNLARPPRRASTRARRRPVARARQPACRAPGATRPVRRGQGAACTRRCSTASGPRLYDPHLTQAELEQQVRADPAGRSSRPRRRRCRTSDRARIAQEVADEILGHGPLEPLLRDPDVTEIMVNGPDRIYVERGGKLHPVDAALQRRGAPAAHHRQDRRPRSAAGSTSRARWSTPGCPTAAGSTPSSRRSRSTARMLTIRKFARRPVHRRRPGRLRHADADDRATSSTPACGAGSTS